MIRSTKTARLRALLALALSAVAVLAVAGLATAKDSNDDNIPDRWEKRHNLSLKVDQSRRDQDHDGLRNRAEFRTHNDPRDDDSDGDGISDGDEGAGTIKSFDAETGRLVIDLFGDDEIAGFVTDRTRIRCEDEHSHDSGHHRGRGRGRGHDDGASASRSRGEAELGDDHGGHGEEEPGDDRGGDDNSGPGSGSSDDEGSSSPDNSRDDNGQSNDDNGSGANCAPADLVVGAVVEEAEIDVVGGKAVFEEVELTH